MIKIGKSIISFTAALTLSTALVGCNANSESSSAPKGEQKMDDFKFILEDPNWTDTSEKLHFISEDFNNIFVELKPLTADYTIEDYIKEETSSLEAINFDELITPSSAFEFGEDKAFDYQYSVSSSSSYESGITIFHNQIAYKLSVSDKSSLDKANNTLEEMKKTIVFSDRKNISLTPSKRKIREITFDLDKNIWHDVTTERLYELSSETAPVSVKVLKLPYNDFNQHQTDEELFTKIAQFFEERQSDTFKTERIRVADKDAIRSTFPLEDLHYYVISIGYADMEYRLLVFSSDNELATKYGKMIQDTIQLEEAGIKVALRQ